MAQQSKTVKFFYFLTVLMLIGATALIIYANSLQVPFVYDDIDNIVDNPFIRITALSPEELADVLKSRSENRPVANLSFALNYFMHQYSVVGYHVVNLVIHLLTAFLVFFIARRTMILCRLDPGPIPLLAALLWLVNPVHTQSVTYIVQRMNLLAVLFYLLALFSYIKGRLRLRNNRGRTGAFLLFAVCLISGGLALGAKEIAATLPVFLFLYEWYFFQHLDIGWLRRQLRWIALLLPVLVIISLIYLDGHPLDKILETYAKKEFTPAQRLLTEPAVLLYYLSLLVFPHPSRLAMKYDFPLARSLFEPATAFLSLLTLLLLLFFAVYAARKNRLVSFAVLWFLGTLAIESSVIGLALIYVRRTYLPSIFFFILLTWLLLRYISLRPAAVVLVTIMIIISGATTCHRNRVWQDRFTLWQDCALKSPQNAWALSGLGAAYLQNRDIESAEFNLKQALKNDPQHEQAYLLLGHIRLRQNRFDEALTFFSKTTSLAPGNLQYRHNLGIALAQTGRTDQAAAVFKKIIAHFPYAAETHYQLAKIYAQKNKLEKAVDHYQRAIKNKPASPKSYNDLGGVWLIQGKTQKAIALFKRAIVIEPDCKDAHINLALALKKSNPRQALTHLAKAASIDPGDPRPLIMTGNLLAALGKTPPAISSYEKALALDPDTPKVLRKLGFLYAENNEPQKAIRIFRKLNGLRPSNPGVLYNLACLYAKLNKTKKAVACLEKAVACGYDNRRHLTTDKDLDNIRHTRTYKNLIKKWHNRQKQ